MLLSRIRWNAISKLALMVAMMISLVACEIPRPWCPSPVQASNEVKAWYKAKEPLPSCMREYLKAVGDEQEIIRVNCPES